jgi:hypothetical protein
MTVFDLKIALYAFLESVLGQKRVQLLYAKRSINLYRKAGLIFIHIPKSAGTTVAHEVLGKRAGHFSAAELIDLMGWDEFHSFFSFTVVRNPYDRLVSAYHYARQGGGSKGSVRKLAAYGSEEFETFETFIRKWLVHQDVQSLPIIFRPQYQFVCNEQKEVLVHYVAHAEHLDELSDMLVKTVDLTTDFHQLNVTERKHYAAYYTDDLRKIVYDLYALDFEIFGYAPDLMND